MSQDIIIKLKKTNLTGRGGAAFPTWLKWQAVKKAKSEKKYVICNASEGEPGVYKDGFILKNWPEEVINGIKIALKTVGAQEAIFYLRQDYYQKFKNQLKKIIGQAPIYLVKKTGGYLNGEETTLLNSLEEKRNEPRPRPPYPTEKGLFGYPTLINNVETFFWVSKIARNQYKNHRFYSISGKAKNPGVYELPVDFSVKQILKATDNFPTFRFFLQIGGGASGEIITDKELDRRVGGTAGIIIYDLKRTNLISLMKKWANFFYQENCGLCVPCREGVYRLREILSKKKIDWLLLKAIFFLLKETSFCPFGQAVTTSFESLIGKIWIKR
ncbi:MAG: hypothetical protein N2259_01630 [Patescibacteria group bacterium]|nr:hypothetical protein [Patescibacteria group bacterium]